MKGLLYEEKGYLEDRIFPETSHAYASVLDDSEKVGPYQFLKEGHNPSYQQPIYKAIYSLYNSICNYTRAPSSRV